jgi:hypothetical protein
MTLQTKIYRVHRRNTVGDDIIMADSQLLLYRGPYIMLHMVLYLLRAYFAKKLYKGSILRNHLKRNVAHAIRMVCHVLLLLPIAIRLGFFFSFFEMVCLAGKLATQRNAVQVNPQKVCVSHFHVAHACTSPQGQRSTKLRYIHVLQWRRRRPCVHSSGGLIEP